MNFLCVGGPWDGRVVSGRVVTLPDGKFNLTVPEVPRMPVSVLDTLEESLKSTDFRTWTYRARSLGAVMATGDCIKVLVPEEMHHGEIIARLVRGYHPLVAE